MRGKEQDQSAYKRRIKSGKIPLQLWIDLSVKEQFRLLVEMYDKRLPLATAIMKLIDQAIQDKWLPGYIRREKLISNKITKQLEDLGGTSAS